MKSLLRIAALIWLTIVLPGCVTYVAGERLDPAVVAQIHRNVTTRAQVEGLMGPPMKVDMIDVNQRILHYGYREVVNNENPFAPDTKIRRQQLLVWIGTGNRVLDFEFQDYITDRQTQGSAVVVKRAAVTTQPSDKKVWFIGGDDSDGG